MPAAFDQRVYSGTERGVRWSIERSLGSYHAVVEGLTVARFMSPEFAIQEAKNHARLRANQPCPNPRENTVPAIPTQHPKEPNPCHPSPAPSRVLSEGLS